MATSLTVTTMTESKDRDFFHVIILSLIFHIFIFFIIPLSTHFFWKPKKFARPRTFQLVRMPQRVTPKIREKITKSVEKTQPKIEKTRPIPTATKKEAPKQKKAIQSSEQIERKTEDLSELEDLLGGIAEPVSDINFSNIFPYSWYERNIMNKVEQHWKPPLQKNDIFVLVCFSIFTNGTISDVRIKKSSGNRVLDNLAVRAVKLAAPFGKLPPGYSGNKLDIDYTLRPTSK